MAEAMMIVSVVSTIASAGATLMGSMAQAQAQQQAGQMQMQAAQHQAALQRAQAETMRRQANHEMAVASVNAAEQKKKNDYLLGQMKATASASGFESTGVMESLGVELGREGDYRELMEIAGGEMRMADNQFAAQMKERDAGWTLWQGQAAKANARSQANATILGGIGNTFGMLGKFAGGYASGMGQISDASQWRNNTMVSSPAGGSYFLAG